LDRPLTFFLPSSPLSTALYVFADTFDKGKRASEVEPGEFPPETAPPSLLHFFDGTSCFLALNLSFFKLPKKTPRLPTDPFPLLRRTNR
jgi:hypothetical protein